MNTIKTVAFALLLFFACATKAQQQRVLVVFAEDAHIHIPQKFLTGKAHNNFDSSQLRYLTLKYHFYNVLAQRLAENGQNPVGGINAGDNSYRAYTKADWFLTDSAQMKKNGGKKYFASTLTETSKNYLSLEQQADSTGYLLVINKIDMHTNIIRSIFSIDNYLLDVHFDVYDRNMKHICGRYLRKKIRADKDTYWPAFLKQFSVLPEELALYYLNLKK